VAPRAGDGALPRGRESAVDLFAAPVTMLKGVGARVATLLAKLGVRSIGDLLCLLPQRYEDRTQLQSIGAVRPGDKVLVEGVIDLAEVAFRRRRSLLCRVSDGTGSLTLRFFHFNRLQQERLQKGAHVRCFGEVRAGPTGIELVHPEYRLVAEAGTAVEAALTPIYPATEGLHQQRIRQLIDQALARLETSTVPDLLAPALDGQWPDLRESLQRLHRPPPDADVAAYIAGDTPWQKRLALEELIAHRLSLKTARVARRTDIAPALAIDTHALETFSASLPFALTGAQHRVIAEILADLSRTEPMYRLVQGDVGCGKTVVAAAASIVTAAAGRQVAVMAPTELLAEQHFASFSTWLEPLGVTVAYLVGGQPARQRAAVRADIAGGATQVVVGTHALFQDAVEFADLALVIIDEQHRFGVEQRLQLWQKGASGGRMPHQLVMTATPIPRTLAMTAYADLDCSTIDELPPGRVAVKTVVMQEARRTDIVERIAAHCADGQQAYWVCPLIEESELVDSSAATELERELAEALPQQRIGLVHGRMRATEKERVMRAFKQGEIDVLVATTVIEVGVDVPNATLMIIENAERMGLAQLHQLRGRVGRGQHASSCVLLYKPPLNAIAKERLGVMRQTTDGFEIAQRDLQLRGAGELLGTKQTGAMRFRIADLMRDAALLPEVIRVSDALLEEDVRCARQLVARWIRSGREYANV
jgi:ATP-dependent DNA helicase RecG